MQQSLRPTNLSKYRLEEEEPAPRSSTHAGAGEQATRCLPKQAAVYKLFAANTSPRNGITDGSFWASLPIASKLLVLLVFAQTATWVINLAASSAQGCSWAWPTSGRECSVDEWLIVILTVVGQASLAGLTLQAIAEENSYQLLASTFLSVLVALLWTICMLAVEVGPTSRQKAGLAVTFAGVSLLHCWLTWLTHQQFGWRVHSKINCDFRLKNAELKQRLYFQINKFHMRLRLSRQLLLVNLTEALVLALGSTAGPGAAGVAPSAQRGLLGAVGLGALPLVWLGVAHLAVSRNSPALEQAATLGFSILLAWPAFLLYWVLWPAAGWPATLLTRVLLLVLPQALWVMMHVLLWVSMRHVLQHFRSGEVIQMLAASTASTKEAALAGDVPVALEPLLKGAWLLKPTFAAPFSTGQAHQQRPGAGAALLRALQAAALFLLGGSRKRRFFQLSADLTTLRWAWNKYVLLYYVDGLSAEPAARTLTLHMALDPDLTLAFEDTRTYEVWEGGLRLLLAQLTGGVGGGGMPPDLSVGDSSGHTTTSWVPQHQLVLTALQLQDGVLAGGSSRRNLSKRRLATTSFLAASKRSSTTDPGAMKLVQAQAWAASMQMVAQQVGVGAAALSGLLPGAPEVWGKAVASSGKGGVVPGAWSSLGSLPPWGSLNLTDSEGGSGTIKARLLGQLSDASSLGLATLGLEPPPGLIPLLLEITLRCGYLWAGCSCEALAQLLGGVSLAMVMGAQRSSSSSASAGASTHRLSMGTWLMPQGSHPGPGGWPASPSAALSPIPELPKNRRASAPSVVSVSVAAGMQAAGAEHSGLPATGSQQQGHKVTGSVSRRSLALRSGMSRNTGSLRPTAEEMPGALAGAEQAAGPESADSSSHDLEGSASVSATPAATSGGDAGAALAAEGPAPLAVVTNPAQLGVVPVEGSGSPRTVAGVDQESPKHRAMRQILAPLLVPDSARKSLEVSAASSPSAAATIAAAAAAVAVARTSQFAAQGGKSFAFREAPGSDLGSPVTLFPAAASGTEAESISFVPFGAGGDPGRCLAAAAARLAMKPGSSIEEEEASFGPASLQGHVMPGQQQLRHSGAGARLVSEEQAEEGSTTASNGLAPSLPSLADLATAAGPNSAAALAELRSRFTSSEAVEGPSAPSAAATAATVDSSTALGPPSPSASSFNFASLSSSAVPESPPGLAPFDRSRSRSRSSSPQRRGSAGGGRAPPTLSLPGSMAAPVAPPAVKRPPHLRVAIAQPSGSGSGADSPRSQALPPGAGFALSVAHQLGGSGGLRKAAGGSGAFGGLSMASAYQQAVGGGKGSGLAPISPRGARGSSGEPMSPRGGAPMSPKGLPPLSPRGFGALGPFASSPLQMEGSLGGLDSPRFMLQLRIPRNRRNSNSWLGEGTPAGLASAGPSTAHSLPHDDGYVINSPSSLASYGSHSSIFKETPSARRTGRSSGWGGGGSGVPLSPSGSGALSGSPWARSSGPRRGMALQVAVEVLDYKALQMGRRLGQGAEGAVYEARYQDAPVAVKDSPSLNEIEMYMAVGVHDNVVGLRGLCQKENGSWCLVLEFCGRGTLDTMLHHGSLGTGGASGRRADMQKLLLMMRGIARGMVHLHTRRPPILHRDLKPANIFVGHGMLMKIGDLGMSRHVSDPSPGGSESHSSTLRSSYSSGARSSSSTPQHTTSRFGTPPGGSAPPARQLTADVVGTMAYAAPELLDETLQLPNSPAERLLKVDVYSFGVTVWEMVSRRRPREGMDGMQICAMWIASPESMKLPPIPVPDDAGPVEREVLAGLQDLVDTCTSLDPDQRPTFKQVVERIKGIARLYEPGGGKAAGEGDGSAPAAKADSSAAAGGQALVPAAAPAPEPASSPRAAASMAAGGEAGGTWQWPWSQQQAQPGAGEERANSKAGSSGAGSSNGRSKLGDRLLMHSASGGTSPLGSSKGSSNISSPKTPGAPRSARSSRSTISSGGSSGGGAVALLSSLGRRMLGRTGSTAEASSTGVAIPKRRRGSADTVLAAPSSSGGNSSGGSTGGGPAGPAGSLVPHARSSDPGLSLSRPRTSGGAPYTLSPLAPSALRISTGGSSSDGSPGAAGSPRAAAGLPSPGPRPSGGGVEQHL